MHPFRNVKREWLKYGIWMVASFFGGTFLHFLISVGFFWMSSVSGKKANIVPYSMALGLGNALAFAALIGAFLFSWITFGAGASMQKWFKLLMVVSLTVPLAPLLDWVFHASGLFPFTGYANSFGSELDPWERLMSFFVSFNGSADPRITWGHRIYFTVSACVLGFASYRAKRTLWRALATACGVLFSFTASLAFFSPSNVPPESLFVGNAILASVAWLGAVWFFWIVSSREESRKPAAPLDAELKLNVE